MACVLVGVPSVNDCVTIGGIRRIALIDIQRIGGVVAEVINQGGSAVAITSPAAISIVGGVNAWRVFDKNSLSDNASTYKETDPKEKIKYLKGEALIEVAAFGIDNIRAHAAITSCCSTMVALVETNQGKVFLVGMTWAINNQAIGNSVDLQGFLKTPLKAHSNIDFGTANSEQKHTIELMWESYTTLIPCIDITFDDLTSL